MGKIKVKRREARRICQRIDCEKQSVWMPLMTMHTKKDQPIKLEIPEMACCSEHKNLEELELLGKTDLYNNAVSSFKIQGLPIPKKNTVKVDYRMIV